jgi:NADPH:quinone reductase
MFTRPANQTPDMQRQHDILTEVSQLLDKGTLKTTLTHEGGPINAANLIDLHRQAEGGKAIGKMVLSGF